MSGEKRGDGRLTKAGLLVALLVVGLLILVSRQPTMAQAGRLTGEFALGLLAYLGTCRWLLVADRTRITTVIRVSLGLAISSVLAGMASGAVTMTTAASPGALEEAGRREGWVPFLLDLTFAVSFGALFGAITARFRQTSRQS